jgi:hypothetical protein
MFRCEICQTECETELELEVEHRACRLKAAFPGAYSEKSDGIVTFDMKHVAESLGLFNDIILGRDGQTLHPLEGDIHFRISAAWYEPEIWIQIPVQVGNEISTWSYRIKENDWLKLVEEINQALNKARIYIKTKNIQ